MHEKVELEVPISHEYKIIEISYDLKFLSKQETEVSRTKVCIPKNRIHNNPFLVTKTLQFFIKFY